MAVTIAEPNDINTIDPNKEYHVLVYEKAPDSAGIKRLGIGDWKNYLGYNQHKVDNLESYTGMDTGPSGDWDWTVDADNPYQGTNLKTRIDNICAQTGVPYDSSIVSSSLSTRIQTLETDVGTPSGSYTGTLFNRMNTAQDDISDLQTAIGSGGGGSSSGLTARVSDLETFCGNTTQQFAQGDAYTNITNLKNEVEGYDQGGVPILGLSQIVRGTQSASYDDGLQNKVAELEKQMNGNPTGTPSTADLYHIVLGQDGTGTDSNCLNVKTNNLNTDMYVETNANVQVGLKEQLLGPNGSDWSNQQASIAATVAQHTSQIESLSTGAYKYQGDIYAVTPASGNTTTLIISADGSRTIQISELGNGFVYNINPISGNDITIQINGTPQTYTKGSNIAWVKDNSEQPQGGHFDELGTAIDVTRIDTLETNVNTLNGQVGTLQGNWGSVNISAGGSWSATGLSGFFMFTAVIDSGSGNKVYSFISAISNGVFIVSSSPYFDIAGNFTDAFNTTGNVLSLNSGTLGGRINWLKLGV